MRATPLLLPARVLLWVLLQSSYRSQHTHRFKMLAAALLTAAATAVSYQSPSRNPCKVRVGPMTTRNDPYRASVIASPYKIHSPNSMAAKLAQAMAATVLGSQEFTSSGSDVVSDRSSSTTAHPEVPSSASSVVTVSAAPQERFVIVRFKHETCMYRAPFRVAVNDVVVVEADRGFNTGTVAEITSEAPSYEVPNRILRRASADEVNSLSALREREKNITVDVQKTAESVGLGIKVVDTEFQTDMNKLTIYFSSRAPVDFRKLQRSLFREFRCRIWLVNWSEVEFRRRQADRCLGVSICSKLGSRLAPSLKSHNDAPKASRRSSLQ